MKITGTHRFNQLERIKDFCTEDTFIIGNMVQAPLTLKLHISMPYQEEHWLCELSN